MLEVSGDSEVEQGLDKYLTCFFCELLCFACVNAAFLFVWIKLDVCAHRYMWVPMSVRVAVKPKFCFANMHKEAVKSES